MINIFQKLFVNGAVVNDDIYTIDYIFNYINSDFNFYCLNETHNNFTHPLISDNFLNATKGGQKTFALTTLGESFDPNNKFSPRTQDISNSIVTASRRIISPFTGKYEQVDSSLGPEWFFHNKDKNICLISQFSPIMVNANLDTIWVFPLEKFVLYFVTGYNEDIIKKEIAKLLFRCISNSSLLINYLFNSTKPRKFALTDPYCQHMAHNLWNVQTGIANCASSNNFNKIENFLLHDNQNFFGLINELFIDKLNSNYNVEYLKNENEIFLKSMIDNYFLLTIKDEYVTDDFALRVINNVFLKVNDNFKYEADSFCADKWPLIVITVRLDNRSWIEQGEGYACLLNSLFEKFPNIGVIIDGLSSDSNKGWTTAWMSLDADLNMAEIIRSNLNPSLPCMFSVGRTFYESIYLNHSANFFVAPSGSGMAVYKWLSNMPGIAFSNRSVLDENSPDKWHLRVWHNPIFRDNLAPTAHVPYDFVVDGDIMREHISRSNFHMDWKNLYAFTMNFINDLK
jgi:hypothetical protein